MPTPVLHSPDSTIKASAYPADAFNRADQSKPSWVMRAQLCAELIAGLPHASPNPHQTISIADGGCGDQKLRTCLADARLNVRYTGYDVSPVVVNTVPFDLRRQPLPGGHDVAVMLRVIEYLEALEPILIGLALSVPTLVLSHVIRQGDTTSPEQLQKLGWVNHLRETQLSSLLLRCGFTIGERRFTPDQRTLLMVCHLQHGDA